MSTIKDVAKKAGVSLATASYALNGDERIKEETRKKVLEAAKEIEYIPNGSARNLRRQKTNIILVFVSSFGGPIYQEIRGKNGNKFFNLACEANKYIFNNFTVGFFFFLLFTEF